VAHSGHGVLNFNCASVAALWLSCKNLLPRKVKKMSQQISSLTYWRTATDIKCRLWYRSDIATFDVDNIDTVSMSKNWHCSTTKELFSVHLSIHFSMLSSRKLLLLLLACCKVVYMRISICRLWYCAYMTMCNSYTRDITRTRLFVVTDSYSSLLRAGQSSHFTAIGIKPVVRGEYYRRIISSVFICTYIRKCSHCD